VPAAPLSDAIRDAIDKGLRARLGTAVRVEIEEVAEIPAERSGKFRYVVSHVEAPGPQNPGQVPVRGP